MINFTNKKVGIVLSGGGAKGIHQVGMFQALEEMGLSKDNLSLAGTSIGAINSLTYACFDHDTMSTYIHGLRDFYTSFDGFGMSKKDLGKKAQIAAEHMRKNYPDDVINKNNIPITVCAFSSASRKTEYFKLSNYSAEEQRMLTFASADLPGILPPVDFRGALLSDGGVLPTLFEPASPIDKIPVNAFAGEDLDILIISYLKPEDQVDISEYQKKMDVYEIKPSRPLEKIPGTGTLNFSEDVLIENEKLGYKDTINALA